MNINKYTNKLINETSPYLLQHAHNPVNWNPWDEALIERAKSENKLLLVSIGYSACHWCHVMEHESFENEEIAAEMNTNFINIKIDREERPDIDHYYMTAVQLMQQNGGWPLNIIALPDGRPIWGGTYFPKETWLKSILAIAQYYNQNPDKTIEYAKNLQKRIEQVSLTPPIENIIPVNKKLLETAVENWKPKFDMKMGGRLGSPKFPMPVTLDFLLYYGHIKNDKKVLEFVETTLLQMARGGIYDQIGGGFARYSVDEKWKVPHFEKMLYDNGQLLSLYSKAYQLYQNNEFKTVVYETVDFIKRELTDKTGAFYSSLDADSEGEEGKFYVWKKEELLQTLTGDEFKLFADYYNINSKGFWEHDNYILLRNEEDQTFAEKHGITITELNRQIKNWKTKLFSARSKRVRPGLDDKTLTAWNALVIQGLSDAYTTFHNQQFLDLAEQNARFIVENQMQPNGKLFRNWKKGKSSINGFMEDYALTIQSFISLFEITGNNNWLKYAQTMVTYTVEHFFDHKTGLFYFSENSKLNPVTNHFQNEDNVIPAANSVMANNLHKLYLLEGNTRHNTTLKKMLQPITPQFSNYPMAYANWGSLMIKLTEPYYEVAVTGSNSKLLLQELQSAYQPNIIWAFSNQKSEIPILNGRFIKGKNLIYVCHEGVCQLPVETAEKALKILSAK